MYMFPFDKIEKGSKVIIYGAGEIGTNFKYQIDATQYCKIVCFIDKNAKYIVNIDTIKCDTLNNLNNYEFDYLIVASIDYKDEIYKDVLKVAGEGGGRFLNKDKIILLDKKDNMKIIYNPYKSNTPNVNWKSYYHLAETCADNQFNKYILPLLEKYVNLNTKDSVVLDFACGYGRIANIVRNLCKKIICCDISEEAIEYCKNRFYRLDNISYIINDMNKIELRDNSCDLIYSWDAMVHFSYKLLDIYTDEFYRILKPHSYAIIHHSNLFDTKYVQFKSDIWSDNPGSRSNVSAKDYAYIAKKHGFEIVEQNIIDWEVKDLDCITVLKKE